MQEEKLAEAIRAGAALDHLHGSPQKGTHAIVSEFDLHILDSLGLAYRVAIADMASYYRKRNATGKNAKAASNGCDTPGGTDITDPENFHLGSYAGYFTYDEMLQELDEMHALYPELISERAPIHTFQTYEGRPIYHVKISDNPNDAETEEEQVLYSALHHAREPASLSQLIYFMWYLLENYGEDARITDLLNEVELVFVPMLNPDGYVFNEEQAPQGGGLWRKNRTPQGNGLFGVDLNRNYGYEWGTSGISFNPQSDVYCGEEPFSEAETQAMRWLCEQNEFYIALNAHTFGNLLLHPFGYDFVQSPDHDLFQFLTAEMVRENGFANILSAELYPASGDSDDWMYVETPEKPQILALTPEIGAEDQGFWPVEEDILPLCQQTLHMNLSAALMARSYGRAFLDSEPVLTQPEGTLNASLVHFGKLPAAWTVEVESLTPGFEVVAETSTWPELQQGNSESFELAYTVGESVSAGSVLNVLLEATNGLYTVTTTAALTWIGEQPSLNNASTIPENWSFTGEWATTTEDFVSEPTSITDSPFQNYENNQFSSALYAATFDLSEASFAYARFWARWNIETGYDLVRFDVRPAGASTWQPQCGLYTRAGTEFQGSGDPVYDGNQDEWVYEFIDLNDFVGSEIEVRFLFFSDQFVVGDGFYFDDFEVFADNVLSTSATLTIDSIKVWPNPTSGRLNLTGTDLAGKTVAVYNAQGKEVLRQPAASEIELGQQARGVYQVVLLGSDGVRIAHSRVMLR